VCTASIIALTMEAVYTKTTWRYIPEGSNLLTDRMFGLILRAALYQNNKQKVLNIILC
jgi:hypothetical protein